MFMYMKEGSACFNKKRRRGGRGHMLDDVKLRLIWSAHIIAFLPSELRPDGTARRDQFVGAVA